MMTAAKAAAALREPRDASSRLSNGYLPLGAATIAPSSRSRTRCCASSIVLRTGKIYYDCTPAYEELLAKRIALRWIRMLLRYGYITPSDAQRLRAV